MYIVTIEGLPYDWLESLQELHAHVFDGAILTAEKLAMKNGLLYSWLGGVHVTKRGQGIASQLMKKQHEYIKTLGFDKVRTYGRNTFKTMLIANLKHGFDIASTFVDEKGRHKIIFEKTID